MERPAGEGPGPKEQPPAPSGAPEQPPAAHPKPGPGSPPAGPGAATEVLAVLTAFGRRLLVLVPVYLAGAAGLSVGFVLFGLALYLGWRRVRDEKERSLRAARQLLDDEERLTAQTLYLSHRELPAWVSARRGPCCGTPRPLCLPGRRPPGRPSRDVSLFALARQPRDDEAGGHRLPASGIARALGIVVPVTPSGCPLACPSLFEELFCYFQTRRISLLPVLNRRGRPRGAVGVAGPLRLLLPAGRALPAPPCSGPWAALAAPRPRALRSARLLWADAFSCGSQEQDPLLAPSQHRCWSGGDVGWGMARERSQKLWPADTSRAALVQRGDRVPGDLRTGSCCFPSTPHPGS